MFLDNAETDSNSPSPILGEGRDEGSWLRFGPGDALSPYPTLSPRIGTSALLHIGLPRTSRPRMWVNPSAGSVAST